MPEAAILAKITVNGAEDSTQKILRFSDTVDKAGDKAKAGGKKTKEAFNGVQESVGALNSGLGVLGLSAGVGTLLSLGRDAVLSANGLEKTEASVAALSGSTERYNEVLDRARQGQALYGGSLQANLQSLGSFVNLSNRTGVELDNIDNIVRRLAAKDPLQGVAGSTVALMEALSGTGAESLISLRDRFEIPKDAIAAMGKEGITAQEKINILDKALADLGITNEFLASTTDTNAAAFDRFGSAVDNAKTAIGGLLQEGLLPYIESATGLLGIFSGTEKGAIDYANAMYRLTGAGRDLTESEQEQVVAIGRFLGIIPEAAAATDNAAAATDRASASLPPYIAYLQGTGSALERVTAQLAAYESRVDAASDAVNRANLETEVAERSLRDEQAAVEDANDAVAAQERVVRQAEAGLSEYSDRIKEAEGNVAAQERAVKLAEQGLQVYTDRINEQEAALKNATREIERQEAALKPLKDNIKAISSEIDDQNDRIADAEKAYGRYETSIDRAKKRLDRATEGVNEAKAAFDGLKDGIKAAEQEMDRLKGTPLMGSAEMQAQLDAITDERTKLELALVQAQRRGASDEEIEGLKKQIEALDLAASEIELADKVANDDDRRKIERYGEAVKEMSGDQILAALAKQQQQVDSLTKQLGPAGQAYDDATAAQERAQRSVERAERAYARYKDSLHPLRDELGLLKDRLDDANDALQTEDDKIRPLRDSLAGLKQNVDDARDAYDLANEKIDAQREMLETLKTRVDDAKQAYADANVPIDAQRAILETLKDRQQDANDKLADAEALLKPYYEAQQTANDKLVDANLALAKQKELLDPVIESLKLHTDAAANDAKATNDQAVAWERWNAAVRAAPSWGSTPDYLNGVAPFNPGGDQSGGGGTMWAPGTIGDRNSSNDPRPSQAGIDMISPGASMGAETTFDADRGDAVGRPNEYVPHQGLDIQISDGSPVYTPVSLRDISVYKDTYSATGTTVQGRDTDGRLWLFAHMNRVPVKDGQNVPKGALIGYVGAGMGHVHVQLMNEKGVIIDPSQALNDAASGIGPQSVAGSYQAWHADDAAAMPASDPARAAEDAAYLLDTAVDSLASVAGYKRDKNFLPGLEALKTDFKAALQAVNDILVGLDADGVETSSKIADGTGRMVASLGDSVGLLMDVGKYEHEEDFGAAVDMLAGDYKLVTDKLLDIASQLNQEGVDKAALLYEATEGVMAIVAGSIAVMANFQDYQGIMPNLLDWYGADLRLLFDKMLDIAQYYSTDGVTAAADLFEGVQRTFAPLEASFALVDQIRQYKGFPPTVLDWIGGDQRKIIDKIMDIAQYYNADGVNAAADMLEGAQRTFAPLQATIALADDIRSYKGFPPTVLDWIGGDLRAIVDKVIDVDRYITGGEDAAVRVNQTLLAVSEAMATGMSMADAVAGYEGGGQATAVFGDIVEFIDSVTDYFADVRSDGVRPALLALKDLMYFGGQTALDALGDALTEDLSGIEGAGKAAGEAYMRGFNSAIGGINAQSRRGFWNGGLREELYSIGEVP